MYEPHLLQPQAQQEMLNRLHKLTPQSQALWGKMDVAQMLAHVAAGLEVATSNRPATQTLLGRIIGPLSKRQILNKGLPKNSPTAPNIKITDPREFHKEKQALLLHLEQFVKGGEAGHFGVSSRLSRTPGRGGIARD